MEISEVDRFRVWRRSRRMTVQGLAQHLRQPLSTVRAKCQGARSWRPVEAWAIQELTEGEIDARALLLTPEQQEGALRWLQGQGADSGGD